MLKIKTNERRTTDDYLQEVYDSLVTVWDKDKFDMSKGYDDEYECECIKITYKDNDGVYAKIYVDDYEGRHPTAFDVVYHYPGDKGVGVMGSYEFQSTDMEETAPEIFDYFDEVTKRASESLEPSIDLDKRGDAELCEDDPIKLRRDINSRGYFVDGRGFYNVYVGASFKGKFASVEDAAEVGYTLVESKKCEDSESEYIQDFRSYMDTMDGEPYSEDALIGWGWEWLSEKEEYPNGTKTCVTTYTMTDNGVKYKLVVRWNSFMETIDGYELTQESANESKKSEGLPPKRLGSNRKYRSRADLINKMKQLGAVEITTSKQFNDIKNSQWLHTAGYALDTNGNLVAQSYYGDKDGKWYYTSTRNFDSDYLPESKQHENRTKEEEVTNIFKGMKEWADRWSNSDKDRKTIADSLDLEAVQENMSDIVEILDNNFEWNGYGFKFVVVGDYEDDDTRDEADANQWNTCYGVCEEIADLIGIPDEGPVLGEMNTYFWEEIEADWRDDESKPAESKKSEGNDEEFPYGMMQYRDYDTKEWLPVLVYINTNNRGWFYEGLAPTDKFGNFGYEEFSRSFLKACKPGTDRCDPELVKAMEDFYLEDMKSYNNKKVTNLVSYIPKGVPYIGKDESKKSESLSLKQKELKDMARYGEAEDITTISDAEAKELRKKGIETVGVSRGTYGMNGALLRDKDGKKYVITARSSNLFYFV